MNFVFMSFCVLNVGVGQDGGFQMFKKYMDGFSHLKKNLRERLIHYGEKEESTLFEVRMGFQKPVHLTSPLQEGTRR